MVSKYKTQSSSECLAQNSSECQASERQRVPSADWHIPKAVVFETHIIRSRDMPTSRVPYVVVVVATI